MEAAVVADTVEHVPFVRHSGIQVVGSGPGWAIAGVEQRDDLTSHAGTFQGAALYAVAETAVSAVLATLVEEDIAALSILVTDARIGFTRPATGRITAHATSSESPERIRLRFARDGSTALAVVVRVRDAGGTEVGSAEFSCRITRRPQAG
jgi:acyl-coenzyme A thioesterase PaaI-like protein